MFSYTVTIGRNYGSVAHPELAGQPMSSLDWAEFEDKVAELLSDLCSFSSASEDFVEIHRGTGIWGGVREESAKLALYREYPLTESQAFNLRSGLAELAEIYGQDAICLSIGQSELVSLKALA